MGSALVGSMQSLCYFDMGDFSGTPASLLVSQSRCLSSRQALGDVAGFVSHANAAYGLGEANKWVTFGGSYPGMLAGWARLKFPHLVFMCAFVRIL